MIPTLVSFNPVNQLTNGLVGKNSSGDFFPLGLGLVTFGFLWGEIWVSCCDDVVTLWMAQYNSIVSSWTNQYSPVATTWTEVY